MSLTPDVLTLDTAAAIDEITAFIRDHVHHQLRRRGVVVAVSGGIDSAVCASLCVAALGPQHVHALFLPERDSSPISHQLGLELAEGLGIDHTTEDIAAVLEAAGCYARQDDAIRMVVPEYGDGWASKITLPSILEGARLNVSRITVQSPDGEQRSVRLSPAAYLQLVAATNFKQRTRTMMTYFHADARNYAVCGTPNRLEYDQGFFVKGGDGLADFKPIAHLYKTQVYALAAALGVPEGIRTRPPTTDTFSLSQSQEEFYFALPYPQMDLCLYGLNQGASPEEVAPAVDLSSEQVQRVFDDIQAKRRATWPLHVTGTLVRDVELLPQPAGQAH